MTLAHSSYLSPSICSIRVVLNFVNDRRLGFRSILPLRRKTISKLKMRSYERTAIKSISSMSCLSTKSLSYQHCRLHHHHSSYQIIISYRVRSRSRQQTVRGSNICKDGGFGVSPRRRTTDRASCSFKRNHFASPGWLTSHTNCPN